MACIRLSLSEVNFRTSNSISCCQGTVAFRSVAGPQISRPLLMSLRSLTDKQSGQLNVLGGSGAVHRLVVGHQRVAERAFLTSGTLAFLFC